MTDLESCVRRAGDLKERRGVYYFPLVRPSVTCVNCEYYNEEKSECENEEVLKAVIKRDYGGGNNHDRFI